MYKYLFVLFLIPLNILTMDDSTPESQNEIEQTVPFRKNSIAIRKRREEKDAEDKEFRKKCNASGLTSMLTLEALKKHVGQSQNDNDNTFNPSIKTPQKRGVSCEEVEQTKNKYLFCCVLI